MKYLYILLILTILNIKSFPQETQNKVYFNIPGNNKINTEDTIQKLMIIKKIPIQKKEAEVQDIKLETDVAKELTKYLRDLDEKSRGLYDFKTPFREMVGTSSDTGVLDVSAERKAKKDSYKITVMQTAKPDSFMSASTPKNRILPPCEFSILINGKSAKIKFSGGTLSQLSDAIQQQAGDLVNLRIINDTGASSILVLSGRETGEKNKINFTGDIGTLSDINLLENGVTRTEEYKIDFSKLNRKSSGQIISDSKQVMLKPGDEGDVNLLPQNIKIGDGTYFYFKASVTPFKPPLQEPNAGITNVDINLMEPVTVSNVEVLGGSLISYYEEWKELPEEVSNFIEIVTLAFDDGTVKTYLVNNSGDFSNSLSTYRGKTVSGVTVRNKNTDREVLISDAEFLTRISEGGIQPKNIISKACDSIINFNGVEVKRDRNVIDDLVDGVSFNLKNESKESVTVTVDHDNKKVEDALIAWADSYNKAMEYLHIVTKPNLDRTPLNQRSQDNLKIGVFETESTMIILMNRLRDITEEPYQTIYNRELRLLEQIGLYTKKTGSFSMESDEWASASMGLLNIDIDKLRSELKSRYEGVEQLFAYDTHGNLIKDSGVAVAANQALKLGIGPGSFLERRISFNENKIIDEQREIEKMNRDLLSYELDLREKYGKMNQAINESDEKQKWLSGQMKNNQ